ncbi:hypothetical protein [Staphylococcus xylosus]|uniref:hypothetical protein n=1 Tax=Staphylococcus xylosus TaxID=1288 RepID=UPI001CDD6767|nr:hypothetical protein [Staphylococcus xylosus]MEB8096605.1 hypothetical protein [Staphylococcus xylosus]UBV39286.1 hypothetical protein JGY87_08665 [Staphylococcus xylosus]
MSEFNKDKQENDNRLAVIESIISKHDDLKDIKEDLKTQNEDLKLIHKLNAQSDIMLKIVDEIKEDLGKNISVCGKILM